MEKRLVYLVIAVLREIDMQTGRLTDKLTDKLTIKGDEKIMR